MPAAGLKIFGTGTCLPWCSISSSFQNSLKTFGLGLHDISHAIFNAHLVSKGGSVISSNFHHVCEIQVDNEPIVCVAFQ